MMFALIHNVVAEACDIRLCQGERSIRSLPFEEGVGTYFTRDQMRETALDLFDEIRDRQTDGQSRQHMDMVLDAADGEQFDLHASTLGLNALVHGRLDFA